MVPATLYCVWEKPNDPFHSLKCFHIIFLLKIWLIIPVFCYPYYPYKQVAVILTLPALTFRLSLLKFMLPTCDFSWFWNLFSFLAFTLCISIGRKFISNCNYLLMILFLHPFFSHSIWIHTDWPALKLWYFLLLVENNVNHRFSAWKYSLYWSNIVKLFCRRQYSIHFSKHTRKRVVKIVLLTTTSIKSMLKVSYAAVLSSCKNWFMLQTIAYLYFCFGPAGGWLVLAIDCNCTRCVSGSCFRSSNHKVTYVKGNKVVERNLCWKKLKITLMLNMN